MRPFLESVQYHREAGMRLRKIIDAAAIPQVLAAQYMGVTKSNLGNWLRGEAPIPTYALYRFCLMTGATADWVLLGKPDGLPLRLSQHLALHEPENDC